MVAYRESSVLTTFSSLSRKLGFFRAKRPEEWIGCCTTVSRLYGMRWSILDMDKSSL